MEMMKETVWLMTVARAAPKQAMSRTPTKSRSRAMFNTAAMATKTKGCLLSPMPRRMELTML